ncbi:MAG: peptidylprolyl isomerase [Psittacicella sp.]
MKKIILLGLLVASISTSFATVNTDAINQKTYIVATVNNYPILNTQVNNMAGGVSASLAKKKAALNTLIDNYLIQQYIVRNNLYVTQDQLNKQVSAIAAQNKMPLSEFYAEITIEGLTKDQYLKELKQHMESNLVEGAVIKSALKPNPSKILALGTKMYKDAQANGTVTKETVTQYLASDILLQVTPILSSAQAFEKLEKIRAQILSGKATFEEMVHKYSQDYGSVANNGSLGWAFPQTYVAPFAAVLVKTPVGGISEPFQDKYGWQMLKVINKKQVSVAKDYYISKAYEQLYKKQEMDLTKNWKSVMRSNAYITYLNTEYK